MDEAVVAAVNELECRHREARYFGGVGIDDASGFDGIDHVSGFGYGYSNIPDKYTT